MDCLDDLPDPWLYGSHVCGEPYPVERAFGGRSFEVISPVPGDLVWYLGDVPPGYGRLYEVAEVTRRGLLRLVDMELVLWNVAPADVRRVINGRVEAR